MHAKRIESRRARIKNKNISGEQIYGNVVKKWKIYSRTFKTSFLILYS